MSFYLPNPDVRPTGAEIVEHLDVIPPEFEANPDPPAPSTAVPAEGPERDDESEPEADPEQLA